MNKIETKTWIGWALTVIISVSGAWVSMNARIYTVESQLQVLRTRVEMVESGYDRQSKLQTEQSTTSQEIKQSLIRIEGALNLKADKQWK